MLYSEGIKYVDELMYNIISEKAIIMVSDGIIWVDGVTKNAKQTEPEIEIYLVFSAV